MELARWCCGILCAFISRNNDLKSVTDFPFVFQIILLYIIELYQIGFKRFLEFKNVFFLIELYCRSWKRIQLVPIKTLQSLHAKFTVINVLKQVWIAL